MDPASHNPPSEGSKRANTRAQLLALCLSGGRKTDDQDLVVAILEAIRDGIAQDVMKESDRITSQGVLGYLNEQIAEVRRVTREQIDSSLREKSLICKRCSSEKQGRFTVEMNLHFPGREALDKPSRLDVSRDRGVLGLRFCGIQYSRT